MRDGRRCTILPGFALWRKSKHCLYSIEIEIDFTEDCSGNTFNNQIKNISQFSCLAILNASAKSLIIQPFTHRYSVHGINWKNYLLFISFPSERVLIAAMVFPYLWNYRIHLHKSAWSSLNANESQWIQVKASGYLLGWSSLRMFDSAKQTKTNRKETKGAENRQTRSRVGRL